MQTISTFSISHAQNQSAYPLCLVEVSYTFVTWNNKAICRRSYIIIDTSFVVIICLMWNPSMAIYVYGMLMVLHSKFHWNSVSTEVFVSPQRKNVIDLEWIVLLYLMLPLNLIFVLLWLTGYLQIIHYVRLAW